MADFNVHFKSNLDEHKVVFGEVNRVSDGGYERGYDDGYAKGYAEGETAGNDYVLTEKDRNTIAQIAAQMVNAPTIKQFNNLSEKVDDKADGIVNTALGEVITLTDSSESSLKGLTVYGKSVQDGTPTPDAPVPIVSAFEDGGGGVYVGGRNLCPKMTATSSAVSVSDGVATQITADTKSNLEFVIQAFSGGNYVKTLLNPTALTSVGNYNCGFTKDDSFDTLLFGHSGSVDDVKCKTSVGHLINGEKYTFSLELTNVTQGLFSWKNAQINAGTTALPYEPYKPVQTLIITTPLHGIPVTSGGNYTDASGQQWVTDEVDFVRGVKVQRVGYGKCNTISLYNNVGAYIVLPTGKSSYYDRGLSSIGQITSAGDFQFADGKAGEYTSLLVKKSSLPTNVVDKATAQEWVDNSNITVAYILSEPIETPLTEEELAAYQAIRTNYPNTTIYADDNAGLSVAYKADTKHYIDKKFNELQYALLATGGNI